MLFVNGIPLVVEAKIGDATPANPMRAAFEQLLRYRNGRTETIAAGLREGEPHLFHTNLLLICTCGEKATYGSVTSGYEQFYAWKVMPFPSPSRISMGEIHFILKSARRRLCRTRSRHGYFDRGRRSIQPACPSPRRGPLPF